MAHFLTLFPQVLGFFPPRALITHQSQYLLIASFKSPQSPIQGLLAVIAVIKQKFILPQGLWRHLCKMLLLPYLFKDRHTTVPLSATVFWRGGVFMLLIYCLFFPIQYFSCPVLLLSFCMFLLTDLCHVLVFIESAGLFKIYLLLFNLVYFIHGSAIFLGKHSKATTLPSQLKGCGTFFFIIIFKYKAYNNHHSSALILSFDQKCLCF